MSRAWTQEQKNAIDARDGTLLVSAAAGSGKTAVLVQRVIERLTDPVHPSDADRLLVVTFTKAGAAEMKDRIAARISELLVQDPTIVIYSGSNCCWDVHKSVPYTVFVMN